MNSDVIGNSRELVQHSRNSCESPWQKGASVILNFLRCSRWFETIICFSWTCQSTRIFIHQSRDNLWLGFPNALFGKSFWLFDIFSNNVDYCYLIHWLKYWVGWNIVFVGKLATYCWIWTLKVLSYEISLWLSSICWDISSEHSKFLWVLLIMESYLWGIPMWFVFVIPTRWGKYMTHYYLSLVSIYVALISIFNVVMWHLPPLLNMSFGTWGHQSTIPNKNSNPRALM